VTIALQTAYFSAHDCIALRLRIDNKNGKKAFPGATSGYECMRACLCDCARGHLLRIGHMSGKNNNNNIHMYKYTLGKMKTKTKGQQKLLHRLVVNDCEQDRDSKESRAGERERE